MFTTVGINKLLNKGNNKTTNNATETWAEREKEGK